MKTFLILICSVALAFPRALRKTTRNQRINRRRVDRLSRRNMRVRERTYEGHAQALSASLNAHISKGKRTAGVNNQVYQSRSNVKRRRRVPSKFAPRYPSWAYATKEDNKGNRAALTGSFQSGST